MSFTRFGSGIWSWEPFRRLERDPFDHVGRGAKLVWIALYTAPESRQVPCLFCGSITTLAESMGSHPDDVRAFLDRLRDDGLVEIDVQRRVIRLCELPDCGESPTNGNTIRGWFRRFQNIPACPVRDQHVHTLRWLMDEYARVSGKPLSPDHAKAWNETFGRLSIPAPRLPARKHIQTDLFEAPPAPSQASGKGSNTLPEPDLNPKRSDQSEHLQIKENQVSGNPFERVQPWSGSGSGSGSGLGSPDPDPERGAAQDLEQPRAVGHLLVLQGGGRPEQHDELDDLIAALHKATTGWFKKTLTTEQRAGLRDAIRGVGDLARTPGWIALLGEYVTRGMPLTPRPQLTAIERATHGPAGISCDTVTAPGWLPMALQHAIEWKRRVDEQAAIFSQSRRELGFE